MKLRKHRKFKTEISLDDFLLLPTLDQVDYMTYLDKKKDGSFAKLNREWNERILLTIELADKRNTELFQL